MTRREILNTKGIVSHKQAIEKAHIEFDKHQKMKDNLPSSVELDFIKSIEKLEKINDKE